MRLNKNILDHFQGQIKDTLASAVLTEKLYSVGQTAC